MQSGEAKGGEMIEPTAAELRDNMRRMALSHKGEIRELN